MKSVVIAALFLVLKCPDCFCFMLKRSSMMRLPPLSASLSIFDRIRELKKSAAQQQPRETVISKKSVVIPLPKMTKDLTIEMEIPKANNSWLEQKPWSAPVTRINSRLQRVSISDLQVGKAYTGVVKNVIDNFGVFVDIGSVVDGLVHISDVTQLYFATSLENRFRRGQQVTVWVKDLDLVQKRIKLRMFPYHGEQKFKWNDLTVKQQVNGTVAKFSDGALYLDIGAPMMGYLPRRNMRFPRGKRRYRPIEIAPFNSTQKCYIREANERLKRLVLTTYPPEVWDIFLPPLVESTATQRAYKGRLAEQAMMTSANQKGPKERKYEESNEEDDDELDSEVDSFSPEQIAEVAADRKASLLIDDFAEDPTEKRRSKHDDEYREITTKELFKLLSDGKNHITLRDFKDWWYVRMLKKVGDWDGRKFRAAIAEASGGQFLVREEHLERFLKIFAEKFGIRDSAEIALENAGDDDMLLEDNDEDGEDEEKPGISFESMDHPPLEISESFDDQIDDIDDIDGSLAENPVDIMPANSVEDARWMLIQMMGKGEDVEKAFKSLLPTARSRTIKLSQVQQWTVCAHAQNAQIVTSQQIGQLFHDSTGNKPSMSLSAFVDFARRLSDLVIQEGFEVNNVSHETNGEQDE